jgi:hypothetical protein
VLARLNYSNKGPTRCWCWVNGVTKNAWLAGVMTWLFLFPTNKESNLRAFMSHQMFLIEDHIGFESKKWFVIEDHIGF